MEYYTLDISKDDYEVIRAALMKQPAEFVYELIGKLDLQVATQFKIKQMKELEENGR